VVDAEGDETAERASQSTGRDEETDTLGEVALGVPERQVESHGLTEHGLTDTDEKTTSEDPGSVLSGGLASGGDGPDHGTSGDGVGRVDSLGEEGTGDRARDVGDEETTQGDGVWD